MRKTALVIVLLLTAFLIQGCVVIHSEEETVPAPTTSGSTDSTIREINAAGMLSFDNDKQQAFKRIAQRSNLSDEAQVHLVEAIFRHLSFENAKVDVLMVLVKNSSFSPAAEGAILDRLSQLSFENDKAKVLDAISKRK